MHTKQIITIAIVLAVLASGVYLTAGRKQTKPTPVPTIMPTAAPTFVPVQKGSLTLRNPAGDAYAPGSSVAVSVYADSVGKNIVGYDAVVDYDPETTEFKSAKSMRPDFDVSAVTKGSQVYLTGTKKLASTDASVFASDQVAEMIFTVKKVGELSFKLVYTPGKTNTSNLITDTNENVLGRVEPATAYAGYPLNLTQGVPVNLEGGVIVILDNAQGMAKNCADCMETATLGVKMGGETKEIQFRVGGIAGFMDIRGSAFGYTFLAESFADGRLSLSYFRN